jgi:hypothetical protein
MLSRDRPEIHRLPQKRLVETTTSISIPVSRFLEPGISLPSVGTSRVRFVVASCKCFLSLPVVG